MHITKSHNETPTLESHSELCEAYSHFNATLFDDKLPNCLVTLSRKSVRTRGYFRPECFERYDETACVDEIALNADLFKSRTDKEVLSTLVHEMAHCWQQHFGKPSRSGYHNKEWAEKMDELGLTPSSTGKPDGKRTGQSVSHYINDGAAFDKACDDLIAKDFRISWKADIAPKKQRNAKRAKYVCDRCSARAWGKDGLRIVCGDCDLPMKTND